MSYQSKPVAQWSTGDFMSFISGLNIKGKPYNQIQTAIDENGLMASDIKGTAGDIKDLFGINIILARKINKALVKLNVTQKVKTSRAPPMSSAPSNSPGSFEVNLRGKQMTRVTLRKTFTKNSTIGEVALAYKLQECVELSYKVEKVVLMTRGKVMAQDKTLGYYGITNSLNLISVIFKTKGGSDNWSSRTVDEWDTDDLKSWILTMNFEVADESRILSVLIENGFAGNDLKDAEVEDIAEALEIEKQLAQRLYIGLRDWKVLNTRPLPSNGARSDAATLTLPPLPYRIGFLLDCKDSKGVWAVAEVIAMNQDSITIKYINWFNQNTQSGYYEDTFDRTQIATHCKEYGVITNKNHTNAHVYQKKRFRHPTKTEAKGVRDAQKAKLKANMHSNRMNGGQTVTRTQAESGAGFLNSIASMMGYNNNNNNNNNSDNRNKINKYGRSNSCGIIGLKNLGNQCYMNSAIQLVVNTPPLLRLFSANYTANSKRQPLLCRFVDLCKQAQCQSVYNPSAIKNILAQEDYASFGNYSQQDAGHALSALLQILDRELVNNKSYESDILNCRFEGGLERDSEQIVIEQIMNEYNPNQSSVIRDSMTFILREIYECMTPNCDYLETRYNYVHKLVLPLENHSMRVPVTIYSTKSPGKSLEIEFVCLSYCGLNTFTAQIHRALRNRNKSKDIRYGIELYAIEHHRRNGANTITDPCQILTPIDVNQKCNHLIGKSVFVIANRLENDADGDDDMKETEAVTTLMKQFYICVDNKGKVNGFKFSVITATIGTRVHTLPLIVSKGTWWIYYQSRVLSPQDRSTVQRSCDTMLIVYTKSRNNQCIQLKADGYEAIDNHWRYIEHSHPSYRNKNVMNYAKVSAALFSMKQNTNSSPLRNEDVDYESTNASILVAIQTYDQMAQNQRLVSKYLSSALQFGCAAKCGALIHPKPLSSISECLRTYLEAKILDGGASVSCTKCKECKVFKQSTVIVRHPEICTLLLDRFDDGRKYDEKVAFNKRLELDAKREIYNLYSVCNHRSSSTDFGHYYAYVKSADKNNSVWYNANDRSVTAIRNEKQVTENKNALVLMYQKKGMKQ